MIIAFPNLEGLFFTKGRCVMSQGTEATIQSGKQEKRTERLLNTRPMFLMALYLILGIFFAYLQAVEGYTAWWILLLLLLPSLLFFFLKNKLRAAVTAFLLCLLFAFGYFSFSFQIVSFRHATAYQGTHVVTGRVIEKEEMENGHALLLDGIKVDGVAENGKMIAYLVSPYSDSIHLLDEIETQILITENVELSGAYGFRAEEIADDVRFVGNNAQSVQVVDSSFGLGKFLRERMTETLFMHMDKQTAAVTVAMLFGDTSSMESGLLENVRYGGIAHIFAVSGLHVGAVFMACSLLFRSNRLPKLLRFLFVAVLLFFYGDMCGFSASIIRAIVTCLTLYACKLLGWKYDGLESLSLAAILVFGVYPTLLFGIGAQLSFAACLGIVLLKRNVEDGLEWAVTGVETFVIEKLLRKKREKQEIDVFAGDAPPISLYAQAKRSVCSYAAVSFSAQLFTIPLLYSAFGYFSPVSFLLNLVFVPVVTSIFCVLLLFVLVAAFFSSGVSTVILYLPNVVWSVLLLMFETADFTSLSLSNFAWGGSGAVTWYASVTILSDKFNLTKRERIFAFFLFFSAFVATMVAMNI